MAKTKRVSVPVQAAPAIREVADYYLKTAQEKLTESHWFQTCPADIRGNIELTLKGIEHRAYGSLIGGNSMIPVLVAVARDDSIGEEIEILMRLDRV